MDNTPQGYIISEATASVKPNIIRENNDTTTIECVLQEGDLENRNHRIYPTQVIKEALESPYVKERLAKKAWYGEAGHPLAPNVERQMYIDQTRISHLINKIWFENNLLKGIVQTAPTACGRDMQGLINIGSEVAFSMRGFGPASEKKGDITYIKSPLNILTYDWVIHPSHKVAYMTRVINESASFDLLSNDKLSEDYFEPIYDERVIAYINDKSKNVQHLKETYEFSDNGVYNKKDNTLILKEANDTLVVNLEKNIQRDLDDFFTNLF